MTIEPLEDCGKYDSYRTSRSVLAGSWNYWREASRRKNVRILVRDAWRTKYNVSEPQVVYID